MQERRWLLAAVVVASGELAASRAANFAEAWPVVAVAAALVALFGFGAGARGWHHVCLFLAGAALFFHAAVPRERALQMSPWLRGREHRLVARRPSPDLASLRAEAARRLSVGLEGGFSASALNRAILLGERARLPPRLRRIFAESGALHVFAVSGLHVTAVTCVLALLLRLMLVPRRFAGAAALPGAWGYVCLIGAPPSAVRAALMASFCCLAPVFWRRPSVIMAWSLTLLSVCVVDPVLVTGVGCLLSFTVMLAIVLAGSCLRSGDGAMAGTLWITFSAWAAGVPITAHVFGHVTPGGLLANLVLIPAAGVTVAAGSLGALSGFFSDSVAAHFNNLAALSAEAMAGVASAVASIPGSDFVVSPWPVHACAAWYGALIALFAVVSARRRRCL